MSGHPQQETKPLDKPFKMSDDFKHLITVLPPHSAYETLALKPQALIEQLEYAINATSRTEQRAELQRLDDKRRFKPFLDLLKNVVQDWRLQNFIDQTLTFLSPNSEAVQEFYAEEDGLNKRDEKETNAAQQVPPGSPTADDKVSNDRYNIPGSVARRISFTHNIGQPPASSTNPSNSGKKSLEEEMPLLPTVTPPK